MIKVLLGAVLLVMAGCSGDGYERAKYCGAVGVTVGGAVDEQGRPLDEFDEKDKQRSYRRLARLGPSDLRDDWEAVGDSFVADPKEGPDLSAIASQETVTRQVKEDCGIDITVF